MARWVPRHSPLPTALPRLGALVVPVLASDINSRAICVSRLSAISSSASDLLRSAGDRRQTGLTGQRPGRAVAGNLVVFDLLCRGNQRQIRRDVVLSPRLPR